MTKRKPGQRLSASDWAKIEALWQTNEATLRQLSEQFDIGERALLKHFAKKNITKGELAEGHEEEVKSAVTEAIKEDSAKAIQEISERIARTKEDHYKWAQTIDALIINEVLTARKEKRPIASITDNVKALKIAREALRIGREERYKLLGLDDGFVDPDDLPELVIRGLSQEEEADIRDSGGAVSSDPDEIDMEDIEDLNDIIVEGEEDE